MERKPRTRAAFVVSGAEKFLAWACFHASPRPSGFVGLAQPASASASAAIGGAGGSASRRGSVRGQHRQPRRLAPERVRGEDRGGGGTRPREQDEDRRR